MRKKLTLSVEESLILFIHMYAKETGISVSQLVNDHFQSIQKAYLKNGKKTKSAVAELYGLLKDHDVPDKYELRRMFHEKHLD